jgi:hypothetical protein
LFLSALINQPFSSVFLSQQISISQLETIQRTGRLHKGGLFPNSPKIAKGGDIE